MKSLKKNEAKNTAKTVSLVEDASASAPIRVGSIVIVHGIEQATQYNGRYPKVASVFRKGGVLSSLTLFPKNKK